MALPSLGDVYFRKPCEGKTMAFMPGDDPVFGLGERVFKYGKRQSVKAFSIRVQGHDQRNINGTLPDVDVGGPLR